MSSGTPAPPAPPLRRRGYERATKGLRNSAFVVAAGRVKPASEELKIGSELDGKLAQVLVEEGDKVRKGQTLAVLVNGDYAARVSIARTVGLEEANFELGPLAANTGRNSTFPATSAQARAKRLWTSSRVESEKIAAQARANQARESFRQTKLSIVEEVRRSMIEWRASRNVLDSSEKTAAARRSVELSRLRFESDYRRISKPIRRKRLSEAEDLAIRSRYDVLRARARNARARGNVLLFFEGI